MTPITELLNCNTIAEVKQVRRKYIDSIPYNRRWHFDNWILHSMMRIKRIEAEKKESYKELLN